MTKKSSQFLYPLLLLMVMLSACNGQASIAPSATPTLAPSETPIPSPSSTSTTTPTLAPTETPIPQPASLVGTVLLSSGSAKPFASLVELRQGESFTLIASSETDANGVYKIENIDPGMYDLWVLITQEGNLSGCGDVAPPDDTWKLGITFGGDKGLTMENAYLSKGLMLVQNLQSSDLQAEGYYAVLEGFEIESGIENKMDVTLFCM